jgi:enoyl-CoA hydratase
MKRRRRKVRFERRVFYSQFELEDQTEGTDAFITKRTSKFKHK